MIGFGLSALGAARHQARANAQLQRIQEEQLRLVLEDPLRDVKLDGWFAELRLHPVHRIPLIAIGNTPDAWWWRFMDHPWRSPVRIVTSG